MGIENDTRHSRGKRTQTNIGIENDTQHSKVASLLHRGYKKSYQMPGNSSPLTLGYRKRYQAVKGNNPTKDTPPLIGIRNDTQHLKECSHHNRGTLLRPRGYRKRYPAHEENAHKHGYRKRYPAHEWKTHTNIGIENDTRQERCKEFNEFSGTYS